MSVTTEPSVSAHLTQSALPPLSRKIATSRRQKAEKARLRQKFMWIFVRGKQKRVRRPPTIEGMDPDDYIRLNADPTWLHQEGFWECLMPENEDPTGGPPGY